jgi:very-short-patch-repair endonuclease
MRAHTQSRSARQALALQAKAQGLRTTATVSERRLWSQLSARKLGTVFRRQAVLCGRYVVDFVAPAERVVVEIDGSYHQLTRRADARRDAALERAGYRVVRLEVEVVMQRMPKALARIRAALVESE